MQIILDLTEDQADKLSRILWAQGYESSASELRDIIDPAIADAKNREVSVTEVSFTITAAGSSIGPFQDFFYIKEII